jgi:nicotinate-nucleotide pyrophosphorylase (carboxylating)
VDQATFRAGQKLIDLALKEDLGDAGDITSLATIGPNDRLHARIVAKQTGVVAGLAMVVGTYATIDAEVEYLGEATDGSIVLPGTIVCELKGSARSILAGERTALNFLQRLSGIATLTRQFVEAVSGRKTAILDTRKTTPGWRLLEKYAVQAGGGVNHRIGLYDAVLIKDNHISAAGSVTQAVQAAQAYAPAKGLDIVVEVENFDQLDEVLSLTGVTRILLDNMSVNDMKRAVERVAGRVPLEASGNMSLERVRAVADTGVNFISVGALTHSARAFDFSMRVERL